MDLAFVATPPDSHLRLVLLALRHGKDVIVEKPAFPRVSDFDEVAGEARRAGRRVLVAENYCYKPLVRVLRGLLAEQVVGRTLFVQVNAMKGQRAQGWRARTASGALVEGGVHWIDLLAHLGPSPRSVETLRAGPADGPERSSLVVVRYEDGALGTLLHSWEAPSWGRGLQLSRIRGTEGSIVFESNGLFVLVAGRVRRLIWPGLADLGGYRAMFFDFFRALRGGPEPLMTLARARRDVEIALGGEDGHGLVDRGAPGRLGRRAHLDLGDVQGLSA